MHTPGTGKEGGGAQRSKPSGQGFTPPAHHDSAGGSSQFKQKGGDNSIQEYGSQASGSELADAAAALHLYLDARAAGAWGAACEALAPKIAEDLVRQLGGGGKTACPKLLQSLSAGAPPAAMREAAEANVAALRSHGDVGFLLFKGADGEPFFIPMRREGGHWKVAAIAPSNLL